MWLQSSISKILVDVFFFFCRFQNPPHPRQLFVLGTVTPIRKGLAN